MTRSHLPRAASLVVVVCAVLTGACSVVESGGAMVRRSGEAMTGYSKENEGVIGSVAGFGGTVNTAVGTAVESAARDKNAPAAATTPEAPAAAASSPAAAPAAKVDKVSTVAAQPMGLADAQKLLAALGYQPGPADGSMGKRTVDALSKFQRDSKLPVTGKLDAATAEALRSAKRPG
jgi:peptidoglycan hydrolase-like protein with peptidoglycan-binding domain